MWLRVILLSVLTLLMDLGLLGAQDLVDSLLGQVQGTSSDTLIVAELMSAAEPLELSDPHRAIWVYTQTFDLCLSIGDSLNAGRCHLYTGLTYYNLSRLDSARASYEKAAEIFSGMDALVQLGATYNNIANAYHVEGQFSLAGDYHEKAIPVFEAAEDTVRLTMALGNLASSLSELGLTEESLELNLRAVALSRAGQDSINLGYALHNAGVQFLALDSNDIAERYFLESGALADHFAELYLSSEVNRSLADLYNKLRRYEEAEGFARVGVQLADSLGISIWQGAARNRTAFALHGLGRSQDALEELVIAKGLLEQSTAMDELSNTYGNLAEVYRSLGDYRNADHYMMLQQRLVDSLDKTTQSKYLAGVERRYQLLKKERALADQELTIERQNRRLARQRWLVGGLLVVFVMAAAFIYSLFRQRRISKALQAEKMANLEREKNLSTVQAMLDGQEHERARIAKDLHDGLGGLMWSIKLEVEKSIKQPQATSQHHPLDLIDQASDEVRRIAHDMMPSSLELLNLTDAVDDLVEDIRKSSSLRVEYRIEGEPVPFNRGARISSYRMIQELVQNTQKHAQAEQIKIDFIFGPRDLTIEFFDDGKGFDTNSKDYQGIGLSSLESRVEHLQGTLQINSQLSEGTKVKIMIPYSQAAINHA